MKETGPVITLPEDEELVLRLRAKLEEYRERLSASFKAPEVQAVLFYKIQVLSKLLEKDSISTWDFSKELEADNGWFDLDAFNTACAVISSYCAGNEADIVGGTGLPEV